MKKYYSIFVVIVFFFAISCKDSSDKGIILESQIQTVRLPKKIILDEKYLVNRPKSDSLCIYAVESAKEDIKNNKGVYVQTICYGCGIKPYQAEIEEVLKNKKFKLGIEELGCVAYEGQTRGCYRAYVNLKMKEKFGANYASEIENEAEKLFIKHINEKDVVISAFDLNENEMPQSLNKGIYFENDYRTTIKTDLPIAENSKKYLFLDFDIVVEKNGTLTQFEMTDWACGSPENKKFKQQLIDFSINTIKEKYNNWKPGIYKANKVRTKIYLRITFV
jgi:hypothetical protein